MFDLLGTHGNPEFKPAMYIRLV